MKIEFSTSNIAFEEYGYLEHIQKILNDISDKIWDGQTYGPIMDVNGNKIGQWSLD